MRLWFVFSLALTLAGCISVPSVGSRLDNAQLLADAKRWEMHILHAGAFKLASYLPDHPGTVDILTIYIEGDGLSWITRSRPSQNPTPLDPIGLKLALRHPNRAVAYLARPCQFIVADQGCDRAYWTNRRFSEPVIQATQQAIDQIKQRFQARRVVLVGFSGGGAVAALAASRRNDVQFLLTLAGNLDHVSWTDHHRVTPLQGSLNPADEWRALSDVPQLHLVGGKDKVITREIADAYISRFPANRKPAMRILDNFDHRCCWADNWPALLPEKIYQNPPAY